MLSDAGDIADRVMLEDVPSARRYLATVIDAIKKFRKVKFSYTPFYRSKASEGIIIEPYFLRIFKQRWYVIGYNSKDRMVKTYSLDRVNTLTLTEEHFDDPGISVKEFSRTFRHHDHQSEAKHVVLRADSEQAKYLRALPLHPPSARPWATATAISTTISASPTTLSRNCCRKAAASWLSPPRN